MAKKYINTEMLIDELDASCMPIFEKGISGILGDDESIAEIIRSQPAADVQEVRHGKWICTEFMYENGETMCSECKTECYVSCLHELCGDTFPNYCPFCGARMDGKDGE